MQNFLDDLRIPREYARHADRVIVQDEDELAQKLDSWKTKSAVVLSELASYVTTVSELSLDEQSLLVLHVSSYDGNDPWVSTMARGEAQKILSSSVTPTVQLLQNLLNDRIRPILQSHAHPNVNPDTGRKLARAAGGPSALQDIYTSQTWKEECPGIGNVVLWTVKQITSEDYERLWHLIIPPVMILLDDYDAGYKLHGILVVAEMLKRVPADLLKRTGVDRLIFASLKSTLTFLNNPKTPDIIYNSVPTLVSLINIVAPPISDDQGKERFNNLSSILGDGIIGSIWMYASRDLSTIKASIDVLPLVVEGLGIGSVRYLKAMIHQLAHLLLPPEPGVELPYSSQTIQEDELKLAALRTLAIIIRVCASRIGYWKGTILDAAARCWVHEMEKQGSEEIKSGVREVCVGLQFVCPSVINDEFGRFLALDPIFSDLLGQFK